MAGHGLVPDWLFRTSLPVDHKPLVLSDCSDGSSVSGVSDTLRTSYSGDSTLTPMSSLASTPASSRETSPTTATRSTLSYVPSLASPLASSRKTSPAATDISALAVGSGGASGTGRQARTGGDTSADKRPLEEEDRKPWLIEEDRRRAAAQRRTKTPAPRELTLYLRIGNKTVPLPLRGSVRIYSIKVSSAGRIATEKRRRGLPTTITGTSARKLSSAYPVWGQVVTPRLYFDGKKLDNKGVIADYGFEDYDTIDCMVDHSEPSSDRPDG